VGVQSKGKEKEFRTQRGHRGKIGGVSPHGLRSELVAVNKKAARRLEVGTTNSRPKRKGRRACKAVR